MKNTMNKISSSNTSFDKSILPILWFGGMGVIAFVIVMNSRSNPSVLIFLVPLLLFVGFGYYRLSSNALNLFDDVYDEGSSLLVKKEGREIRIDLRDIAKVQYSAWAKPVRVTLYLRVPTELGDTLHFCPLLSFHVEELIDRVTRAADSPLDCADSDTDQENME